MRGACPPCELRPGVHREVTISGRRIRSVQCSPRHSGCGLIKEFPCRFVWQFLAVMVVFAITGSAVGAVKDNDWLSLVVGLTSAALAILVHAWVVRRTEHRAAPDVAREGAVVKTGWGILIGVGMFGAVIANLYVAGHYEIDGLGSPAGAVGLVGFMAGAAVAEKWSSAVSCSGSSRSAPARTSRSC